MQLISTTWDWLNPQTISLIAGLVLLVSAILSPLETHWFKADLRTWQRLTLGLLGVVLLGIWIHLTFPREKIADSSVPIGGIIPYWGDWVKDNAILTNFELCDGEPVKAKDSPIFGIEKPKLVGRFLRGADQNVLDVRTHPSYRGVQDEDEVQTEGHALAEPELAKHTHAVIEPPNGHSHANTTDFIFHGGGGAERLLIPNAIRGQGGLPRIPQELPNGLMGEYPITQPAKTGITLGYSGEGKAHTHAILGKNIQPAYVQVLYLIRVK